MVPSHFVTLDAFPLTPNKKVDRKVLPKPEKRVATVVKPQETVVEAIKSNVQTEAPTEVATGDVVSQISAVWSRILGIETITSKDNFFDLGGHSLLAVQCHRELRDALGFKKLSITDIFRFPVLGDLADRVCDLGAAPRPASKPQEVSPQPQPSAPAAPVAPQVQPSELNTQNERAQARHAAMSKRRALRATRKEKQL
jgi:acyl carrier protein